MHDFLYPACGCDACDESWEYEANDMKWQMLGVAAGRHEEHVQRDTALGVVMSIEAIDGTARSGSESRRKDFPTERLAEASAQLKRLSGPWAPWPRRAIAAD